MEFLTNPDKSLSAALKSKDKSQQTLDHSSIGQRLKGANVEFFQDIYEDIAKKFHTKFPSEKSFPVWDSPILTISNNFMHNGLNLGGAEKDTPIKMSVSLKSSIPTGLRFCSKQSESSEDVARVAAITQAKIAKDDILLFDRGISQAETFPPFDQEGQFFVTRVNAGRRHKAIGENPVADDKILSELY